MTTATGWLRDRADDIRFAVLFLTRLPVGPAPENGDLSRAGWAMPIAGAIVGGLGALAYWLADALGLAPMPCATLAVAATLLATGALHEDGLADTADGLGGGGTRERRLAIMRDSRIGAFGAGALALSLMLRAGALAALAEPAAVAPALIAAHVAARATLPALLRLAPPARADGLSAAAGQPPVATAAVAGLIGTAALFAALGPAAAAAALALLAAATAGVAWLGLRRLGGQTGDLAGALEQGGETLVLLVASAA